jgi:hypothetical protein
LSKIRIDLQTALAAGALLAEGELLEEQLNIAKLCTSLCSELELQYRLVLKQSGNNSVKLNFIYLRANSGAQMPVTIILKIILI